MFLQFVCLYYAIMVTSQLDIVNIINKKFRKNVPDEANKNQNDIFRKHA